MREIQEEGPRLVGLDEPFRLGREPIGQILAGRHIFQTGQKFAADILERSEIGRRRTGHGAGDVHVKSLIGGQESRTAEMPFADVPGGVSRRFQHFRESDFLQRQLPERIWLQEPLVRSIGPAVKKIGEMQPSRVLAGEDAGPRRRANRASGIGIGESHSIRGEPVDVRCAVIRAAVASGIAAAEIVHEDDDDVGRGGGGS